MDLHEQSNVHASGIGMYHLCSEAISNCFRGSDATTRAVDPRPNSARDMEISHQQPHLIEPMKLKIFEEIPTSPVTNRSSIYGSWQLLFSRSFVSTRSSRASDYSWRRDTARISRPTPLREHICQFSPRQPGPLRLSICDSDNGLPDLPQFDRFSFTEDGTLKFPEKSVTRPQSNDYQGWEIPAVEALDRITSIVESRSASRLRSGTASSMITISRPPSEYDALHSHPVSCVSLTSFASSTRPAQRNENGVNILTPMQEEFSPEVHTLTMDGLVLQFPRENPRTSMTVNDQTYESSDLPAPFPNVSHGPNGKISDSIATGPRQHKVQQRMQQWLSNRSRSFSSNSIDSSSTTTSFAEHRRKRAEFYKLGRQPSVQSTKLPRPLHLVSSAATSPTEEAFMAPPHKRSQTTSTTQSEALSFDFTSNASRSSTSSISSADLLARASTIKNMLASAFPLASPTGSKTHTRMTPSQIKELHISLPTQSDVHVMTENEADSNTTYLDEIGGRLRSGGVGMAF